MMARSQRWVPPLLLLLAGGGWLGVRSLRSGAGAAGDVPAFTVAEVPFTRTVAAEGMLKPVRTTVIAAPSEGREPMMIAWMLDDGDPVKRGEVVVRFDALEVTKRLADGQSDRAAADSRIEKEKTLSQTSLHERDRSALVTREELENTRQLGKKDPRFFPRAEVIESEIDESLYERRLGHARDARRIEERLARSRVDLASVERRKAEMFQKQAATTLKHLEIRAPHDGTFVLQKWGFRGTLHAGDRAFPGMRIAEISTTEQMDAEVFVLEADAGGLAVGKAATVVLEAQPDKVWKARVKRVDPFPKPRQPEVPAQYFATLLEIEGPTAGLRPGQRLHASIVLDEQPRALVVPRQAVFRRDNDSIVYRRQGSRFEPIKVKIGAGTVGRLVIADGVRPGDLLALRDPTLTADEAVARSGGPLPRAPGATAGGGGGRRR
jgi:multidrug efflux pump subunit AcrA (membrane-fusion protein)